MWVFRRLMPKSNSDQVKYEVGYYVNNSFFQEFYLFSTIEEAEAKVNYLNGGEL